MTRPDGARFSVFGPSTYRCMSHAKNLRVSLLAPLHNHPCLGRVRAWPFPARLDFSYYVFVTSGAVGPLLNFVDGLLGGGVLLKVI